MAIFKKKTWPKYFEAVVSGRKKFDLRLNDFEIKEGDILILEEWNPKTKSYTGRKIEKRKEIMLRRETPQAEKACSLAEGESFSAEV